MWQTIHEEQRLALDQAWLATTQARLRVVQQDWAGAFQAFEAAEDVFSRVGFYWYGTHMRKEWAEALLARNEPEDRQRARGLLEKALTEFEEMGADGYVEQVKGLLGQLEVG